MYGAAIRGVAKCDSLPFRTIVESSLRKVPLMVERGSEEQNRTNPVTAYGRHDEHRKGGSEFE